MPEPKSTPKVCSVEGCGREAKGRGLCKRHHNAARRSGLVSGKPCSVAGCGRNAFARGMCSKHYKRVSRYGDPDATRRQANNALTGVACGAPGCQKPSRATHGGVAYCKAHYSRMRRFGDYRVCKRLGNGQSTPDRVRQQNVEGRRRYDKTPHGKMRARFNASKRRALKYGCDWETGITKEQFLALLARPNCDVCGQPMPDGDKTIDHIVPLSKGGSNALGNLQMAHSACNLKKNARLDFVCERGPGHDGL